MFGGGARSVVMLVAVGRRDSTLVDRRRHRHPPTMLVDVAQLVARSHECCYGGTTTFDEPRATFFQTQMAPAIGSHRACESDAHKNDEPIAA